MPVLFTRPDGGIWVKVTPARNKDNLPHSPLVRLVTKILGIKVIFILLGLAESIAINTLGWAEGKFTEI